MKRCDFNDLFLVKNSVEKHDQILIGKSTIRIRFLLILRSVHF
jgi:hypothetical protein